jgi:hypothetical protein
MALLAETIVEEFFNYHRCFTIRGVKKGNDEIDLLAVQLTNKKTRQPLHIEVQVSLNPVTYISKWTPQLCSQLNIKSSSAMNRSEEQLRECCQEWVCSKFTHPKKAKLRNELYPSQKWQFMLVHGRVKDERELEMLHEFGVDTIDIADIINELAETTYKRTGTSSIGRDIINLYKLAKENSNNTSEE